MTTDTSSLWAVPAAFADPVNTHTHSLQHLLRAPSHNSEFKPVVPTAADRDFRENTRSLQARQFRRDRTDRKEICAVVRDAHLQKRSGTDEDFPANGER